MSNNNRICFPLLTQQPRAEPEIMRDWGDAHAPVVSVCCATYNHLDYIEDALLGILAQATSYPFEIIIRDDASTDGTTDVLHRYAQRYPNIIRLVANPENQFKKGIRPMHVWPSLARGKYIALCEGDDFWTSPTKLQKQVELLERHPEAVMSVARTEFCQQHEDGLHHISTTAELENELLGFEEVHNTYFHTSTYVVRSDVLSKVIRDYWTGHTLFGDTALRAILISLGPFVFLAEVVSVYRTTGGGIWSSLSKKKQLKWEYDAARKLARILPGKHGGLQREKLHSILKSRRRLRKKNFKRYIKGAKIYPALFWLHLGNAFRSLKRKISNRTSH
jgi:glycosyltransferase involved in cell wall biosynthesis